MLFAKMNYTASVSDFFKSPKWMMNMLLAGVCVFIPLIGPVVIKGWLITGFWGRDDERPRRSRISISVTSANIWNAGSGRLW